jgi:hypothetical protein
MPDYADNAQPCLFEVDLKFFFKAGAFSKRQAAIRRVQVAFESGDAEQW